MSSSRGKLQDPLTFTVLITHAQTGEPVGTGIAVTGDTVITCAHVLRDAGIISFRPKLRHQSWLMEFIERLFHKQQADPISEVGIRYAGEFGDQNEERTASILAFDPAYDDDVAVLKVMEAPLPIRLGAAAVLGRAEESEGNPFRSYGFPSFDHYIDGWVDGHILGCIHVVDKRLRVQPMQLQTGVVVRHGMSGAAVLDTARNLVVGIITEAWHDSGDHGANDAVTGSNAWALNARVLTFPPFSLSLRTSSLPGRPLPSPEYQIPRDIQSRHLHPSWNGAPGRLDEWTGRDNALSVLSEAWMNTETKMVGVIGLGGEGKTSLVREWVSKALDRWSDKINGVFWWNCYQRPSLDELFESMVSYFSRGTITSTDFPSLHAKVHIVAAMLAAHDYIVVLDGFEVFQQATRVRFGRVSSDDLRSFLGFIANPSSRSKCIITSRIPLHDVFPYISYLQVAIDRLSESEGIDLLTGFGVWGERHSIAELIERCGGHALSMSLIGAYARDNYGGDVSAVMEAFPDLSCGTSTLINRVLDRYDRSLEEAERKVITYASALRGSVDAEVIAYLSTLQGAADCSAFQPEEEEITVALTSLERLTAFRLLGANQERAGFSLHPLVKAYYEGTLEADPMSARRVHRSLIDYWLSKTPVPQLGVTLSDLTPAIEAVYHACRACELDLAGQIVWDKLYVNEERRVIVHEINAFDTLVSVLQGFMPIMDGPCLPQLADPEYRHLVLNDIGLSLMYLGRITEAMPYFELAVSDAEKVEGWANASVSYQNMAQLQEYTGNFDKSVRAAEHANELAVRAGNGVYVVYALGYKGWALHQAGKIHEAQMTFEEAEETFQCCQSALRHVNRMVATYYAEHLRQTGNLAGAIEVAQDNLHYAIETQRLADQCRSHIVLGDTQANMGSYIEALEHHKIAVDLGRKLSRKDTLIAALLGRGYSLSRIGDHVSALNDLFESLDHAVSGSYKVLEIDVRVAIAIAYRTEGNDEQVAAQAAFALANSKLIGYYWGIRDSEAVLGGNAGDML